MNKLIILLLMVMVVVVGCNNLYKNVSDCSKCNDNETCHRGEGIFPNYICMPQPSPFWVWNRTDDYNITFISSNPPSEIIPENYKELLIYETICECVGGTFCNTSFPMSCSCNKYCYNKSKIIWIPNNKCEMPIECYIMSSQTNKE